MRLQHDTLSADDRRLLQELARRISPHLDELSTAWVDAWERTFPARGIDPDAYRQVLAFSIGNVLRPLFAALKAADFDELYAHQYTVNREGARAQLRKGAVTLFDQRDLHVVGRIGHPIMVEWINRLFADPVEALQVQLAQERLGAQMSTTLSEAYSDEREGHLQALSHRLQRALHVSELLRKVGQTIVQSLDIEPVLDVTLQTAVQLLDADSAGLTLANRDGTSIQLCRLIGDDQSYVGTWASIDGNVNGWVYRHNRPVRSDRQVPEIGVRSAGIIQQLGIVAFLIVPLRVAGKAIGALGVNHRRERRFTDEDERILQSLADSVAIAIQNARVHAEVREALREAERADHAKSEFVAAVSHEIRSPLNAVLGYVQMLHDEGLGPVTPQQRETLERLETIAHSTLRLTDDLLEHARLDAGQLSVRLTAVPARPLIDELCETSRMLIGERPLRVEAQVSPGVSGVRGDPDRVRQILTNLLTNAVKFTGHGSIDLTVSPSSRTEMIDFTVRDTGAGIHPNDLPRIFDLFYRADPTSRITGAGIGLFLSRKLATLMGGTLTAESELGKGSVFTLSLPAAAE